MKKSFLNTLPSMTLAVMLALTLTQVSVFSQDTTLARKESQEDSARASRIVGVWGVRVTLRRCDTGDPITTVKAMNMFIQGGSLTETGAGDAPIPRGPGLGTWQYLGGKRYSSVFRLFVLNADGSLAGTHKITRSTELSRDADQFISSSSVEIFDVNDNLIQIGCATETARRLE
jgi:hypothetical protein